jgi:tetratricopeptide (TPR) repeat protein
MTSFVSITLAVAITIGQTDGAAERASPRAIAVAIKQLAAPEFEVRQQATTLLWEAGLAAESALRQAQKSESAEVRLRAKSILDDFQYGVFADTPPGIAQLVRRFRRSEGMARERIWEKLAGQAPIETLLAIVTNESDESRKFKSRLKILQRLESDGEIDRALDLLTLWRGEYTSPERAASLDRFVVKHVPHLLSKGKYDKAERVLEAAATTEKGLRDWAVYLLLRGGLDQKIEEIRGRADVPTSDDARALAHLLRVKGDLQAAKEVAEQVDDPSTRLLRSILFDLRDWKELAARQQKIVVNFNNNIEDLGFAAAYHRLAGNKDLFDGTLRRIRRLSESASGQTLSHCREALFLNGFTDEAIQLMTRDDPVEAFKLQIMRQQYTDAFEAAGIGTTRQSREEFLQHVVDNARDGSTNSARRFRIAIQLAQLLMSFGEVAESDEMFTRLASAIARDRDGARLRELAEAELKARMTDRAFAHAAEAFKKDSNVAAVEVLFSRHKAVARTWWEFYQSRDAAEAPSIRLAKLRKLFYRGEVDDVLIAQLISGFEACEQLAEDHTRRTRWLNAIGETCQLRGQNELARRCFETIADKSAEAAIHLADMHLKQEQWQDAAELYYRAWEQGRKPFTLYLHGEMLMRAGQEDDGKHARELARLVPLASASRHKDLAAILAKRGFGDEARKQWELLRFCSTWSEAQMFDAVGALGDAASVKEPLKAAALWEQRMLNCLQENWFFVDQTSYVRIPHLVHKARAKGLLDEGKVDEAIDQLRMCQQIAPANLAVAEEFVIGLEEAGKTDAANEVFERAYSMIEETCQLFPNSPLHHNNLAWTAAKCKRRLDDALSHVQRAIELAPDTAQYVDTLAEVHFQQGNIDQAIENAKRCVELEPDTDFYQQQLARFLKAKQQPE